MESEGGDGVVECAELRRCGCRTEVYSRVVGFYRPVQNWNPSKRSEFVHRKPFVVPDRKG
jgi:anaerobic ribonucleoside-triphosphate reductase